MIFSANLLFSPSISSGLLCHQLRRFGHDHRFVAVPEKWNLINLKNFMLQGGLSSDTEIPTPKVLIDQDSDPNATVVEVTFGDRLGALIDTVNCSLLRRVLNIIQERLSL